MNCTDCHDLIQQVLDQRQGVDPALREHLAGCPECRALHTAARRVSQVMRTGTNGLHGSLWEQNQPNALTANDFFNNSKGVRRPVTHYNQYGATAGGPVVIPKLYNGRNKLFWFFAFEKLPDAQPNPLFLTVPTAAEKAGDFSKLLASL